MDKIFEFGMILGFLNYHPFVLPFEKECLSQEIFIRWLTSLTLPQTSGMKLLSETFLSSAQAILSIHLPQLTLGDKRIWAPDQKGTFSTKSAYLVDQANRFQEQGPLSQKEWNPLLSSNIQERRKHLIWRVAWDALPVRAKIARMMHLINALFVARGNQLSGICFSLVILRRFSGGNHHGQWTLVSSLRNLLRNGIKLPSGSSLISSYFKRKGSNRSFLHSSFSSSRNDD